MSNKGSLASVEFKRALVTGATGFIGGRMIKRLVSEGCQVNALGANATALERLARTFPPGTVMAFCDDSANPENLQRACHEVEVVFHFAGKVHSVPRTPSEEAEFFTVNVSGTERLLRACLGSNLNAFVFFSTVAVYGTGDGKPVTELTPTNPETSYARSKLEAERRVTEFFQNTSVNSTVFRMSLVYGEGERGNFSRMLRGVDRGRFLVIGKGTTLKSMIYVEDVAAAALLAARSESAQGQVFVLSDPHPYSLRQVVETLARHLGVRPPRFRLPLWLARSSGTILDAFGHVLGIRPPLTRSDVKKLMTDTVCDVSKIHSQLGFQSQYSLDEGIRRTVQWYREEQAQQKVSC